MNRLRAGAILNIPSADEAAATPPPEAHEDRPRAGLRLARLSGHASPARRRRPRARAARVAGGKIGTTVEEKTPAAPPGRDQLKVSPRGGPARARRQRRGRRSRRARQGAEGSADAHQRAREDAEGPAEGDRAQGPDRCAAAGAGRAQGKAPEPPKAAPPKAAPAPTPAPAPEAKAPEAAEGRRVRARPSPPKARRAKAPSRRRRPSRRRPRSRRRRPRRKGDLRQGGAASPKPSFFDDLFGSTPAGSSAAARSPRWPASRRSIAARRRKTVKFEDSIIGGTDIKTNTVFGSTGGGVVNTGENSLATDFSREGLGNIDTDEVDPIAEAEVYLAYGRDAQAEEILKDALKKDPQRQEIYLKLLEIHAQHNKPSAFETVAAELYSVSQGQGRGLAEGRDARPPARSRTTRCSAKAPARRPPPRRRPRARRSRGGRGRARRSRRREGDAPRPAAARRPRSRRSSKATTRSISGSTRTCRFRAPANTTQGADRRDQRRRARVRGIREARSTAGASRRKRRAAPRRRRRPIATAAGRAEAAPRPRTISISALDAANTGGPLDEQGRPSRAQRTSPCRRRSRARRRRSTSTSSICRSIREHATFEDPTPSVLDGQWHDAATKLDLAKAYQEMGDVEGAREILQEVLHEGDDDAEGRSAGAAREARLTGLHAYRSGRRSDIRRPLHFGRALAIPPLPPTMRIALGLEYCGAPFTGWQSQPDGRGVQDALERALAAIADAPVAHDRRGPHRRRRARDDAGRALRRRAPRARTRAWVRGVNAHLPADVAVLWARPVAADFHARYAARAPRTTRYLLSNRAGAPGAPRAAHRLVPSAARRRRDAARPPARSSARTTSPRSAPPSARRSRRRGRCPMRRSQRDGEHVRFDFCANAFLHHMIRNIVGALVYVGAGKHPPAWIGELLAGRDRTRAAPTFAPDGLYFTGAEYDARVGRCRRRAGAVALPRWPERDLDDAHAHQDLRHHARRRRARRGARRAPTRSASCSGRARRARRRPDAARAIARALPPFVTTVGLFVDPDAARRARGAAPRVPLDVLQFHGDETPGVLPRVRRPYLKAVP